MFLITAAPTPAQLVKFTAQQPSQCLHQVNIVTGPKVVVFPFLSAV